MNWLRRILPASVPLLSCALLAIAGDAPGIVRRIKPNDIISIHVVGEPELTMDKRVPADGKLSYPYIKELQVAEKATGEVEKMIRDGLHPDYIINPQVSVEIKDYVKQYVTVNGQVQAPGPVELPPDKRLDLIEVLNRARDFTPRANRDKITLNRKGFSEPKVYRYDKLLKESDPEKKVWVEPDDVIDVAESRF
jgi:polysaccharide export outer membrane protein